MTDKEISETRRRCRPDRTNITHIAGCYVSDNREIIARFDQPVATATENEREKYMALLKRSLSGGQGKNLLDITFQTAQVADSDEHRLLMNLRDSGLKNESVLDQFFETVVQSLAMETNYVILLAHDVYDVPYKGRDGGHMADGSDTQFSYIVCSICPVKLTKPNLCFDAHEQTFHLQTQDFVVAAPELGFLFPAFDSRSTNLYNALYYTRSADNVHEDFIEAIFRTEPPMAAADQKETFQLMLSDSLEESCSYDVVQTMHSHLSDLIADHKANHDPEPLVLTKQQVEQVLESCGVEQAELESFDKRFDDEFGADAILSPANLIDAKQMQVSTPDVTIKVNPERKDLVETRVINGAKYILVRADDSVEVNGINIHIQE